MSPEEWLATQSKQTAQPAPAAKLLSPEEWASQQKPSEKSFFAGVKEHITGADRTTTESQSLPEWTSMPELNSLSTASFKTGLGTLFSNSKEAVQIIKSNFPNTQIRQDEKGNFILKSSIDNKDYVIPPGFTVGDIPRAIGTALAFTPAGRAATIPQMVGRSAATQLAIEGTQAATGGEANPDEVVLAGATAPVVPLVGAALSSGAKAVQPVLGKAIQKITGKATPVTQQVDETAKVAAQAIPEQAGVSNAAEEITPNDLGSVLKKAAGNGIGSVKAQEQLASIAKINPQAKAAAERLGIDLPADVFSDNQQIRSAVGLTRSAAGSESEAAWKTSVSNAIDKADDVIKKFDAAFIDGQPSIGATSQNVRNSLTSTRGALNAEARKVYDAVDNAVPKDSIVTTTKLKETLEAIKKEVGENGLSSQEKRLLEMANDDGLTYGRLMREKNLIGQAMAKKESPYGNMEAGALKRLYASLAEDQLDSVGKVGGEELRKQLRGANLLYAKERALGQRIVNAFGQDVDGSIASLMRTAITSSTKGDAAQFSKLMKVVPDDLKKETIATALASVSRSTRGAERGGFGFSEYANTYRGLRANPQVYSEIVKTLGKDSSNVLRDLYEVSKRVTDARANVLTTGKANQALVESLNSENLIGKILGSTMAKGAITGVSAMGGGPIGAAATSITMNALANGKKDAVNAAGKLFASPEFQKLAVEAATNQEVKKQTINSVLSTKIFKNYADAVKLPLPRSEQFIQSALQAGRQLKEDK